MESSIEETNNEFSQVSIEDVQTRHRKERKELQSKIQEMKKNAPKTDKKKRKEALDQIAKLIEDLEKTQIDEMTKVEEELKLRKMNAIQQETSNQINNDLKCSEKIDPCEENLKPQRVSKAQKRRDKKDAIAKQREEEIKASTIEDLYSAKTVETQKILVKLEERQLSLFNIPSDGDCLYNAVRHQLLQLNLAELSVAELRNKTSKYIKLNKNSLIPYMTNTESGNMLTDEEFEKYCDDICHNSSWGGEIELKALSSVLEVPIEVLQADGSPTIQGAEFKRTPLIITYHRHMYSLGEHYNSTIPMTDQQATDN